MFRQQIARLVRFVVAVLLLVVGLGGKAFAGPYTEAGVSYEDAGILAWASGCVIQSESYAGYPRFGSPSSATGPARETGTTGDDDAIFYVVSLGIGGEATLTFDVTIADGAGADLAVFENARLAGVNVFAELGFVEVSSDGVADHFVRFPNRSLTAGSVGPFGSIDPTDVHNLAGKHVNSGDVGLGTPFDLADLAAEPMVLSGVVDLSNINYVRIVDIVGDGLTLDSEGGGIYDAYPTDFLYDHPELGLLETGGFDLDAVAVLNVIVSGDVDGDGFVGGTDLNAVISNWGLTGASRQQGDLNGDGDVGGSDYNEVLANWGAGNPPEPASIPEPGALVVLLIAGFVYVSRRARKRSIML